MIKLHEYLLAQVAIGCKFFYDETQDIYCQFFPLVKGAYIECEGQSYWYSCESIKEAVTQHMNIIINTSFNLQDIKKAG